MAILQRLHERRVDEFVIPGQRSGGMSNIAMLTLLRRMGRHDLTVHGFRSSFRDWAAETTAHPRDVVEMALAHSLESKTEAAYRRGDLFEKRRELMDDWARYCDRPEPAFGNVRQLFETT
jgi:integrase